MNYPTLRVIFDRKKQATKKKKAIVQIEILFNRQRKFVSTGVKVYSDQWKNKLMVVNCGDSIELNNQIESMTIEIREFINQLTKNKEVFTFDKLDHFLKRNENSKSFIEFMREKIESRSVTESTKRRSRSVLNKLEEFGAIQNFDDLTPKNIKLWDDFAHKKCSKQAAIYNYHKCLKVFVREAYALDLIKKNPYDGQHLQKGETNIRKYLTPEELEAVITCEILEPTICKARDIFVFCCYTGLAYVDLKLFNWRNVEETGGKYRIRDMRKKTNTEFNITLLSPAINILKKYNYVLPVVAQQKYNVYLKSVGALAKVKKELTSHVGRHTFATTITLANGVRIETVSKMLGHKNIRTTQIYSHVLQREVDEAFGMLEKKITG